MIRTTILVSAVLILSGCATNKPEEYELAQINDDDLQIFCTKEKPIGSHVPMRVCRTKAQIVQEREATRIFLRRSMGKPIRY